MIGNRIPDDIRYEIQSNNQKLYRLKQRKNRLFNRFYRKSLFYRMTLLVRVSYVLLFVIVLFLYNKPHKFRNEQFEQCWSDLTYSGRSANDVIYIKTNYATYHTSKNFHNCSQFKAGDVIKVEHNYFGKPIHFTMDGWDKKYGIYTNYIYYYMLLFATLITFFFNDGLDFFSHKLLYVFYVVNFLSMIYFFIS